MNISTKGIDFIFYCNKWREIILGFDDNIPPLMKHDLIAQFSADRSANKMDSTQWRIFLQKIRGESVYSSIWKYRVIPLLHWHNYKIKINLYLKNIWLHLLTFHAYLKNKKESPLIILRKVMVYLSWSCYKLILSTTWPWI